MCRICVVFFFKVNVLVKVGCARTVSVFIFQGFSRVMTRPAGRAKMLQTKKLAGRAGSGQEVFEVSRVGSACFQNIAGSGRVTLIPPDPRDVIRPAKSPGIF